MPQADLPCCTVANQILIKRLNCVQKVKNKYLQACTRVQPSTICETVLETGVQDQTRSQEREWNGVHTLRPVVFNHAKDDVKYFAVVDNLGNVKHLMISDFTTVPPTFKMCRNVIEI